MAELCMGAEHGVGAVGAEHGVGAVHGVGAEHRVGAVHRVTAVHRVGAVHGVGAVHRLGAVLSMLHTVGVLCMEGAVHDMGAGLRPQPWHWLLGTARHQDCAGDMSSPLGTGWGSLLSPKVQPVVPDDEKLQELINHMENRCRKWTQRKNHKSCPGKTKPCSRTVLNSPDATQYFPIWPLLSPHSAVWALVFALPVWSRAGKVMERHDLEKQRGRFCPGSRLCAGRDVGRTRQENQTWHKPRSTRPRQSSHRLFHP